ncbi:MULTISPECIES: cell wall-binding repeat-containing protein [unclassified Clostridioides]|uniref:cell wall-binding repeat-containing protein n=1 Tax=unclassified Clostridioides TaxID=2635829 RepID=UPI001D12E42B|nr:cell wall-binding repeat-containing protein [Clostridioides sp. ES-W-0018-02]MCC0705289.1 cell wall-binding repeat-containing protein [Clostridioides sp. ES-S-0049-02]MCC0713403.1 cell wall-binding repeat-containing protein [Clostridioides sp. ES-W-0017-02]
MGVKKLGIIATTGVIALANTGIGFADTKIEEVKLAGEDRIDTSLKISSYKWQNAENAVLINSNTIADALCSAPLATAKNAPVLLTEKDRLNTKTKKEIIRLGVKNIYIIGSTNTISANVEKELNNLNINVKRIGGTDRIDTSLKIAKELENVDSVAVVNGYKGLADAVSIASPAKSNTAILFADKDNLNKNIEDYAKTFNKTYVVGGESSVSKNVVNKLKNVIRFAGADRTDTNAKVMDYFYSDKALNNVFVAKNGMVGEGDLIDALSVGPVGAKEDSPVLLADKTLSTSQKNFIKKHEFSKVTQVGDGGNENVFREILNILKGEEVPGAITNAEFRNKLPELGWQLEGETTYVYMQKNKEGTGNIQMGIINAEDTGIYIGLLGDSPEFSASVKECLKLILPTKGGELYNILKGKFEDQILQLDGKKVEVKIGDMGYYVDIYNN